MTLYMDDFTISAAKHISSKVIKCIQHILAEHELRLNYNKIKQFEPNIAYATGIVIKPNRAFFVVIIYKSAFVLFAILFLTSKKFYHLF